MKTTDFFRNLSKSGSGTKKEKKRKKDDALPIDQAESQ